MNEIVRIYYTMNEMHAALAANTSGHYSRHGGDGWNTQDGMRYMQRGASAAECADAIALLDKVNAGVAHRRKTQTVAAPVGSRPVVPDVLAGHPYSMRRRIRMEDDRAPVRIVVDVGVSHGVKESQLARRGAACAALAMALSETRPVELWAASAAQPYTRGQRNRTTVAFRVKLDNNPLTMAEVVGVLATAAFSRGATLGISRGLTVGSAGAGVAWGWASDPTATAYQNNVRRALMLEPQDIFIPGGYLSEADAMFRDPVAWVNSYVDAQRDTEAE